MFELLADVPAHDPAFAWLAQFRELSIGLEIEGGVSQTLTLRAAGVAVEPQLNEEADIVLKATQGAWQNFASSAPPVGFQSLGAMIETGHMRVACADMVLFARYNFLLDKLFAHLRPKAEAKAVPEIPTPHIEEVTGRYLNLMIEGRAHRLYYEEAGQG